MCFEYPDFMDGLSDEGQYWLSTLTHFKASVRESKVDEEMQAAERRD